jgi:hypothetical protein
VIDEIADTVNRLRTELEALAVRGIRAARPEHLAMLKAAAEELDRIGAEHMAEQIGNVVNAIENDDRTAAAVLLQAQTSLRLFDRVLTLDVAEACLSALVEPDESAIETEGAEE